MARWARTGTEKIMSDFDKPMGTCCCVPPAPGLRLLTFPDGTQSGVFGLDEAFAAVYAEGGQVHPETAEEIIEQLSVKNYIAPTIRQKYFDLIIEEYGRYVKRQEENRGKQDLSASNVSQTGRRTRWFSRLFRRPRPGRT